MTAAAGTNVGLLLERLVVDPSALVERVVQPVMEQLWRDGAAADDGDTPPELLIATALGNRLARVVASEQPPAPAGLPASSARPEQDLAHYEPLIERNSDLAAALGACDCWGEQLDCAFCEGAGTPGWILPDRRMFATYVYPAVRAFKKLGARSIAAGRHAHDHRKENGHVEHGAR
jgi:hypothetical protein